MKYFQHLIGVFVLLGEMINGIYSLEAGECSVSCKKDQLPYGVFSNANWCSCRPSCVQFGDCCLDSPFRKLVEEVKKPLTVCLSVERIGVFSAIASCSPTWKGSHDFCHENIGYLPPVSSPSTHATYANVYCAICNEEVQIPESWKVKLHCSESISNPLQKRNYGRSQSGFFFKDESLWQRTRIGKTETESPCKFQSKNGSDFVSRSIPLRSCNGPKEISKCSFAWPDPHVKQQCLSYLDPVYIQNRIYRNVHCATCNYKTISNATCFPSTMDVSYLQSENLEKTHEYCARHRMNTCLQNTIQASKGGGYAFNGIMDTNMKERFSMPDSNKCRNGEKFDRRKNRCRKSR